jgi:hypothetical protein
MRRAPCHFPRSPVAGLRLSFVGVVSVSVAALGWGPCLALHAGFASPLCCCFCSVLSCNRLPPIMQLLCQLCDPFNFRSWLWVVVFALAPSSFVRLRFFVAGVSA